MSHMLNDHRRLPLFDCYGCRERPRPKATWGGKGFLSLYFQVTISHGGKTGQELKAGTGKVASRLSLWLMLSQLSEPRPTSWGLVLPTVGPPTSIISQDNLPQTLSQANLIREILQVSLFEYDSRLSQIGNKNYPGQEQTWGVSLALI